MRKLLLVITFIAASLGTGLAQRRAAVARPKGIAVAYFDEGRLQKPADQAVLKDFQFFLKDIEEIVKRDFPGVEFRIVKRGELFRLQDGTAVNPQTMRTELGYVLSAPGKRRRILNGVQTDTDFACAAAAFFQRSSAACPK